MLLLLLDFTILLCQRYTLSFDRLVQGTVKFGGGSLMMWGCMSWDGVGYFYKIDGRMDGELYC